VSIPRVSIVLVTRNGMDTLPSVLNAINEQRIDCPVETVAVDSGSTDGSVELLKRSVNRFVSIPRDSFNHGLTRNLGIAHSEGDLIVLLVQDAVPATSTWLAELIAPLRRNAAIAGTYARQRVRPNASAVTRYYDERRIAGISLRPRNMVMANGDRLTTLPPMERFLSCTFDNVCACIRRTVWERFPFQRTPIAEDLEWAKTVLLAGYELEYVPTAEVIHSHERSARYEFARTYVLHRKLFELFQLRTIPTLSQLATATAITLHAHLRCQRQIPRQSRRTADTFRAMRLAVAWPLGQYLGALSAVKGWRPLRFKTV